MKRRSLLAGITPAFAAFAFGRPLPFSEPDEAWLRGLHGAHRQFFDVNALHDGAPLRRVANFLNAYRDAYRLPDSAVNCIVGIHGDALPFALGDGLWARYQLGQRYAVKDASTNQMALRNPFASGPEGEVTIASLQHRGVRVLACRQTIARLARELSASSGSTAAELAKQLEGGLLPGITAVPAMAVAANRAQEERIAYLFVG